MNRNGFDDDEEAKAAFVANVFCQTEGNETALCGNQVKQMQIFWQNVCCHNLQCSSIQ